MLNYLGVIGHDICNLVLKGGREKKIKSGKIFTEVVDLGEGSSKVHGTILITLR